MAKILVLLLVAGAVAGCSSFNREWKASGVSTRQADDLAGRWEGTWLSNANGHTDQLRCLITKVGETNYSARFQAKYRKVFRFTVYYTVPLVADRRTETNQFQGEANLGWLSGGVYRYEGHATGTNFFSTYECKYDHGTFRMTRPAEEPPNAL